jgi:hypothetical protein
MMNGTYLSRFATSLYGPSIARGSIVAVIAGEVKRSS